MKWQGILLLTIAAFITAATFRKIENAPADEILFYKNASSLKKQLSIRCSPLYIPSADDQIPRLTGWGNYSWKISTSSDSAQFYFDQGINMYYAFHIIESRASFDKAARFDPACAMAWWGKALAFGPNINDFGYQRPSEAYSSAKKAMELKDNTTKIERALIEAMQVRYAPDTSKDQKLLNELYRNEMKKVYASYRLNANVSALYADALMLLHPWDLYNHDYTPKKWTPEIVTVLKQSLKAAPAHPGTNHYFIHAVEASSTPGEALKSAKFLDNAMPDVSHITHMPSHIYIRTGYFNKGIKQNDKSIGGYNRYLAFFPATSENVALYSLHNLHMKVTCAQMAGNYAEASSASIELQQQIPSFYLTIPGALGNYVQYLHQSLLFTQVRFGRWEEILKIRVADSLSFTPLLQHFARGIAFTKYNKVDAANKELATMQQLMANPSLKEPLAPFNSVYDAAVIAENILQGVIAEHKKDYHKAVKYFELAVKAEDKLIYNEPRDWLLPARHYLGNALLKAGKYQQAEVVFKEDLLINPNNGWALTGILEAYTKMGKKSLIVSSEKRLNNAWLIKDSKIETPVF